jgi:MoaA/NifB/PqqE/SkfB family radical SAM enzyme
MSKFSPRLAFKALWQLRVRRRPFVLSHGINAKCNLSCRFCEYWKEGEEEMSTQTIFNLLEEARSFGIGVYNAWTTEPLLRQDLPEILKHAKELGLITSLITNGKLLRKRAFELCDLDYLSVSVDGIETYRELRGIDIDVVLQGIEAAQNAGHQVLMNCVISGKNLTEILDLVQLAEDSGALISFEPINESELIEDGIWEEIGIRDLSLYRKTVDGLIDLKKGGYPIINSLTYLEMIKNLKPDFRCHTSDLILHVAANGTITNCRVQKERLGHISEGLFNVWNSTGDTRRKISQECKGCLFFGYVENSLLYDFKPEVMMHYEWM